MQKKTANKTITYGLEQKGFLHSFYAYKKYFSLFLMFVPAIIFFFIFAYVPMYGVTLAFKDYSISKGILGSEWVGLKHFKNLMGTSTFLRAFRNTLSISFLKILFGFPTPIILAILLNEVRNQKFKKIIQTISYMPHFLSWIIISGIFIQLLSPSTGMINHIIKLLGGEPIYFLGSNEWIRTVFVVTDLWAGVGWGTILYIAAISGFSPEYYEAAECDGATRFQKIFMITLPLLAPVIAITLILRMGSVLSAGFDQVFNLYCAATYEKADIIDTYVYRTGMGSLQYDRATAVGLFKNVVGFFLVLITNFASKKLSGSGIW